MIESRLIRAVKAIVDTFTAQTRWHVPVRYRVINRVGDRYNLQAVARSAGWPDILPCSVRPGVGGFKADFAPGSTVLVRFIEGDPAQPVITHAETPGAPGFVPLRITIGDESTAKPAARVGDVVSVLLPPAVFTGTVTTPGGPVALPAAPVASTGSVIGFIETGSARVSIG